MTPTRASKWSFWASMDSASVDKGYDLLFTDLGGKYAVEIGTPISVSSSPTKKGSFELAIRKVGNVTNAIHNLKVGDTVGIRGPFGTIQNVVNICRFGFIIYLPYPLLTKEGNILPFVRGGRVG